MRGFLEGLGAPDVRASKRAKDSGVRFVCCGNPRNLAMRERTRRMSGIERTMLVSVDRRFPKWSMRDMIAKNEEWVAVNVDSIMPASERQLSTTERTRAKAATS